MNLKYLPLGTVCSLIDNAEQIMVVGYNWNNFDYVAVPYPAGMEDDNSFSSFNHNDLEETYDVGYKCEAYYVHNAKLLGAGETTEGIEVTDFVNREIPAYQFDANGVPISEEPIVPLDLKFEEVAITQTDDAVQEETEEKEDLFTPAALEMLANIARVQELTENILTPAALEILARISDGEVKNEDLLTPCALELLANIARTEALSEDILTPAALELLSNISEGEIIIEESSQEETVEEDVTEEPVIEDSVVEEPTIEGQETIYATKFVELDEQELEVSFTEEEPEIKTPAPEIVIEDVEPEEKIEEEQPKKKRGLFDFFSQ